MVTWIIEKNVFRESCYDRMLTHFKDRGIPFHIISIVPFEHVLDGRKPIISEDEKVVCYASIGIETLAPKLGWKPGVFTGTFAESEYRDILGPDFYLNADATIVPISQTLSLDILKETCFIKPDADNKEFAGQVFDPGEFEVWYKKMLDIGYITTKDFKVAVSTCKEVADEYRLVVAHGKIIGGSLYKRYQRGWQSSEYPVTELQELVTELERRFKPADIYDVDIGMTPNGWRVVEYSTFNTAGLYECDVSSVIDGINNVII